MSERPLREAVIDASAIERNTRQLRAVAHTRELIAVVKADGYGHGALTAARAALAGGASRLGVADLAEAHELRAAGIDAPIVAWLHGPDGDFARAVADDVQLGISSVDQLRRAAAAAREAGRAARVHLKLETGLGRNGAAPEEWGALFDLAAELERQGEVRVEGVFSHLSGTSPDDDRQQVRVFEAGLAQAAERGVRPVIRHIAATGAAISLPEARFDAVRVGIGLYGLSPADGLTSADLGLTPAMTLRSRIAAVRRVPAGHGASYGYRHRAERETTFALVPLGYADGVPRQASGTAPVTIGGRRFRVAGAIAMDQFIVDVGDTEVAVGDEVVLFGDPATGVPAVEEWAAAANTINYEIVTRIGNRVTRTEVS